MRRKHEQGDTIPFSDDRMEETKEPTRPKPIRIQINQNPFRTSPIP